MIQPVLRALADIRNGPIYRLWVDLQCNSLLSRPEIGFRIYPVAESLDAYVAVGVSASCPDSTEIAWTISLTTKSNLLIVEAAIELSNETGSHAVFSLVETTDEGDEASRLLYCYADIICRDRSWIVKRPEKLGGEPTG